MDGENRDDAINTAPAVSADTMGRSDKQEGPPLLGNSRGNPFAVNLPGACDHADSDGDPEHRRTHHDRLGGTEPDEHRRDPADQDQFNDHDRGQEDEQEGAHAAEGDTPRCPGC